MYCFVMKRFRLSIGLLLFPFFSVIMAQTGSFVKTNDGIIVYPESSFAGNEKAVKLEVVSDQIIHIVSSPNNIIASPNSLITSYIKQKEVAWSVTSTKKIISLKTKSLITEIDQKTGSISFFDKNHQSIVTEKKVGGRNFEPTIIDGSAFYKITQAFTTTADEGWYGLGQHQQGIMNYKGQQVDFFQNNTEIAIPFLISSKNYGILWDNYSITKAGDVRPFHPLSSLKLFSKDGEEGWLTATYSNDKNNPGKKACVRAESKIEMEFMGDSKLQLPKEFNGATGVVTWEGSIASSLQGLHQLKFTFGGTIKVWIDHQLVLNRWRKAWNPAPALIPIEMKKGEKKHIQIEWIPEGGESYISLKWQAPLTNNEKTTFSFCSEAGRQIDYYFIHGENMDHVIAGYRFLTGKAPIVPKWALGYWQSRERYKTQEEIIATVDEFRKRKIPLDNIVLDWNYWREKEWGSQEFDETRFPAPDSMIDVLHKKYRTQIMISVWPKFYEGIPSYNEFNSKGWLYKRNIADKQRDWIGEGYFSTFYDAFNADARKGFWNLINKKLYAKGIDAWWMDASEPDICSNVTPEKRKEQLTPTASGSAAEFLNAYPLQNAKGIYEGQRLTNPDQRVFLLTRSAFAGSQRYAASVWSGDIGSTWDDMKYQIAAGINYSMSGLPYWTMDIGGFVVPEKFERPNADDLEEWREMNTRWYQFGAFVPLFRSHGQYPFREIFNIAPENHSAYQSFLYYDQLRYRLMPYIYSLAGAAYHNDFTIMRGLAMDFSNDSTVLNIGDEYMFGESLLINPVYQYKQRSRSVYLPKCAGWYNFYDGKFFEAGQHITADAPYDRIPVFVKAGSIIPFGPELQYVSEKSADTITLNVYTGADAVFNLYEDEGINYNYEKGKYCIIKFTWDEKRQSLVIGECKGEFHGKLKKRVFRIKLYKPHKATTFNNEAQFDKEILYEGKTIRIN